MEDVILRQLSGSRRGAYSRGELFEPEKRGIRSWLLTLDHKRIGVMYLWSVLMAFFLGGVFAMLIRLELLTPQKTIITADTYNQAFTLHGATMIFLFIIPAIPASLGNFRLTFAC